MPSINIALRKTWLPSGREPRRDSLRRNAAVASPPNPLGSTAWANESAAAMSALRLKPSPNCNVADEHTITYAGPRPEAAFLATHLPCIKALRGANAICYGTPMRGVRARIAGCPPVLERTVRIARVSSDTYWHGLDRALIALCARSADGAKAYRRPQPSAVSIWTGSADIVESDVAPRGAVIVQKPFL